MHDLRPIIKQSPPIDTSTPYNPSTLSSKSILITGAANGLGARMARYWASHGAHISIGDIDDPAGHALVASLRAAHPSQVFTYTHCDVTSWDQQVALFQEAIRASPKSAIDIVVPNAGALLPHEAASFENPQPLSSSPSSTHPPPGKPVTTVLDVNITGVAYTTHLALHYLPQNPSPPGDRCLLLIGSLASLAPLPGQAQYTMSKHAVAGLFRCLRASAFPHGIRVNMVAPYYVAQTNMCGPIAEAALLAGSAGAATVEDVVDAATRLIADTEIVGRSLMVGPKVGVGADGKADVVTQGGETRAVWDCYADDYEQVESFRWRYINALNGIAAARGYFAWITDVCKIFLRR